MRKSLSKKSKKVIEKGLGELKQRSSWADIYEWVILKESEEVSGKAFRQEGSQSSERNRDNREDSGRIQSLKEEGFMVWWQLKELRWYGVDMTKEARAILASIKISKLRIKPLREFA